VIAVDTNVVMRLLVNDDRQQGTVARALFESEEVWIGVTVLLESAWVLESIYGLGTKDVVKALRGVLGLPNVRAENAAAVAAALGAAGSGLELADALHLARSPESAEFATFDRGLSRAGRRLRSVRLV
jgi:predicted nucleic acid-binding protein